MPPEIENDGQDLGTASETTEAVELNDAQGSESEQPEAEATEQALEAQDPNSEESEEDTQAELAATPKEKSGNFDWKKINEKLGSGEVQKAFVESQRTISRYSQEVKTLKDQVQSFEQTVAPLKEKSEMFEWFDNMVRENPALRSQIQAILAGKQESAGVASQALELPPGVNPDDPLAPIVLQQQQMLQKLVQQSQQAEHQQRQQHVQNTFRQGLVEAKAAFEKEIGRKPSEQELRMVAERMRATNHLKGADWVPSLFVNEIRKHEAAKLHASRTQKKNLPKSLGAGRPNTSKPKSVREAFDEAWEASGMDKRD